MTVENRQARVPEAPKDDASAAPTEVAGEHGGVYLPVLEKVKRHHVGRVAAE
jgi:hypothetical protein